MYDRDFDTNDFDQDLINDCRATAYPAIDLESLLLASVVDIFIEGLSHTDGKLIFDEMLFLATIVAFFRRLNASHNLGINFDRGGALIKHFRRSSESDDINSIGRKLVEKLSNAIKDRSVEVDFRKRFSYCPQETLSSAIRRVSGKDLILLMSIYSKTLHNGGSIAKGRASSLNDARALVNVYGDWVFSISVNNLPRFSDFKNELVELFGQYFDGWSAG